MNLCEPTAAYLPPPPFSLSQKPSVSLAFNKHTGHSATGIGVGKRGVGFDALAPRVLLHRRSCGPGSWQRMHRVTHPLKKREWDRVVLKRPQCVLSLTQFSHT